MVRVGRLFVRHSRSVGFSYPLPGNRKMLCIVNFLVWFCNQNTRMPVWNLSSFYLHCIVESQQKSSWIFFNGIFMMRAISSQSMIKGNNNHHYLHTWMFLLFILITLHRFVGYNFNDLIFETCLATKCVCNALLLFLFGLRRLKGLSILYQYINGYINPIIIPLHVSKYDLKYCIEQLKKYSIAYFWLEDSMLEKPTKLWQILENTKNKVKIVI